MKSEFYPQSVQHQVPLGRHRARAINFHDASVYSYASPGSHWWGYA